MQYDEDAIGQRKTDGRRKDDVVENDGLFELLLNDARMGDPVALEWLISWPHCCWRNDTQAPQHSTDRKNEVG